MNASSWAARYKSRVLARERAERELRRPDEKCRHPHCAEIIPSEHMRLLCVKHDTERTDRIKALSLLDADRWSAALDALKSEFGV